MALSAFTDRAQPPREPGLSLALGRSAPLWRELQSGVERECAPVAAEWGFTSAATGWGLRLKHGKRVLVYMAPRAGHFIASFALGEKAVAAAMAARLPASVLEIIEAAPRYAEGRGVRFDVRTRARVRHVLALVAIKLAN